MPYGTGPLIRQALQHAKPWQRYLIAAGMVALGVILVAIGHVAGALLAAAGVLLLWRMARYRLRRRSEATPTAGDPEQSTTPR